MAKRTRDENKKLVLELSMLGCTGKEISGILEINPSMLEVDYIEELREGRNNLRANLRKAQIQLAIEDRNPTMLIWLGKNYLGQREPKQTVEHGGNVTFQPVFYTEQRVIDVTAQQVVAYDKD